MRNGLRVLLVFVVSMMAWSDASAQSVKRSYSAGNFALELDGVQVGMVTNLEGGSAFGGVVKEEGEEIFVKKHLGFPGYHEINFEIGAGMAQTVYNWIDQSLQGKASPMNGALLNISLNGSILSRLEFTRAQITEVTIPAADATSKTLTRILIGLTPEQTSLVKSPGGSSKLSSRVGKTSFTGNFRLSIEGVNTTRVSKVDALTIKLPFRSNTQGECLHCEGIQAPPPIDFPNVVITLSQTGAESIESWFQNFVINGENGDSAEKTGELSFLSSDLSTAVFTIKFNHLGIFELIPVNEADAIPRLVAAMYCESMTFSSSSGQ